MAQKTPLNRVHRALGARMVDFAGWDMPVQYAGVVAEHEAVRTGAGLFDVSHMGRIEFRGEGRWRAANALITNDLGKAHDGQAVYAGLLNHQGGFVDDVVAYRFSPEHILICVNASNREKDFAWMTENTPRVQPVNRSDDFGQLAIQGPKAARIVQTLTDLPLESIATYRFREGTVAGVPCIVSRTGYTGEDGFELYCPRTAPSPVERAARGRTPAGLVPQGSGAGHAAHRDEVRALRQRHRRRPQPARGGPGVDRQVGQGRVRRACLAGRAEGCRHSPQARGLRDARARHPPARLPILEGRAAVGEVTSGTQGPTVKKAIGIGYVPRRWRRKARRWRSRSVAARSAPRW
jgi:aminomethyltransferase